MMQAGFVAVSPAESGQDSSKFWRDLRARSTGRAPKRPPLSSVMESHLAPLLELPSAPARTSFSEAITRSSPLSITVRQMIEKREFGRAFDATPLDIASVAEQLPALACPRDDVRFPASDRSFDDLSLSVDGLLQHRKRLLEQSIDSAQPRRNVFVLGAGPAGLMAAVQLRMRHHAVVVCEQREAYTRNRYIGVYKEVTHLMAALGMPESMTYDFSQYRGKRGIMLADIQTLLHGIALKLGAVIYTGAVPRNLDAQVLRAGAIELQRAAQVRSNAPAEVGMLRWHHDSVARVASGVSIRFDTILEATGGRSGLRETLVGRDTVVSIYDIGAAAAAADPTLRSYFDDPEDHTAEYVDSGYGCPADLLPKFAASLLSGNRADIPDEIPCFVSNIEASVLTKPMERSERSLGIASRIGDKDLAVPHDWVVLECRRHDQSLSRYHVEGPLPQRFQFGDTSVETREKLDKLNPVSLLLRILYAMGVPFDVIDRRKLIDFYAAEASRGDASDIVSTWTGRFRGLNLKAGADPIWRGQVPGSDTIEYGIIGESLQNAWYRFGVGVDDAIKGAIHFADGFELPPNERRKHAARLERVMRSRSIQILYHLYEVALNKDQGVVGSVLTDCHMEERHSHDLAEAQLREAAREGVEMRAAEADLGARSSNALLEAALDQLRQRSCHRIVDLLRSFPYVSQLSLPANPEHPNWRAQARAALQSGLPNPHRALVLPVFEECERASATECSRAQERLIELASARYAWATPWVRACALHLLNPRSSPAALETLVAAADDANALVREIATRTLDVDRSKTAGHEPAITPSTIEKVLMLSKVRIFEAVPHENLAAIASLLTERHFKNGESVFQKGEIANCLYVIESGHVRVHDGDRTLRDLSRYQSFGELALLDAEPRSAAATSLDRTCLYRLGQDDFYALLSEQPAITRSINRSLCGIIRNS